MNRDGTYDINYDDGEKEINVAAALVKAAISSASHCKKVVAADILIEGDRIEANFKGKGRWFKGKIKR